MTGVRVFKKISFSGFEKVLEQERASLLYWGVVFFGAGIGIYFLLPFEPPVLPTLLLTLMAGAIVLPGIFRGQYNILALGLALLMAGITAGVLRTALVDTETINRETGAVEFEGLVRVVEDRVEDGLRLTLAPEGGAGLPDTVPITVRTDAPALSPGMQVRTRGVFLPLPEPVLPGGYDFARQLWFERIGAVGFAVAPVEVIEVPPDPGFSARLQTLRENLAHRIRTLVPGQAGGVAAALITGIRDGISEQTQENMRIVGLAHLLAISGLHMALVTGGLYFALRLGLALFPKLALTLPIRKIAAVGAFFGALGYLLLSGDSISTQRAFIMASIVLLAILVNRSAISMRLVALAAILILAFSPEALLHPGFQMSFAAVTGLVAAYAALQPHMATLRGQGRGWGGKLRLYTLGIIISTVIAEITIGPIAFYHFGRFSSYGLLANMVAVPLMGFWVMPVGLVGLLLWPLGLDAPAWEVMARGIDVILDTAAFIAALPGAEFRLKAMPLSALVLIVTGGLWICLWQRWRLRRYFSVPLLAGVFIFWVHDTPDLIVGREGALYALRGQDESYYFSSLRRGSFVRELWLQHVGQHEALSLAAFPEGREQSYRCDALGCLWRKEGVKVAFPNMPAAFGRDCRAADMIVSTHYLPFACKDEKPVIGRAGVLENGAHAAWLKGGEIEIDSVGESRGNRPWTRPRENQ